MRRGYVHTVVLTAVASAMLLGAGPASAEDTFTVFHPPTPLSGPCVVTPASDGSEWFLESIAAKVGRIDPSGRIDEYPIPAGQLTGPLTGAPCAITAASDGNIYFSTGLNNEIGRVDPTTRAITMFPVPNVAGNLLGLNDITPGPDNALWFAQTTGNSIGRFDLTSHRMDFYPLPTPAAVPIGMYAASDGGIWFGETLGNKVGRLDIATKQIVEYPIPTPLSTPLVIRAETEGRYLWFGEATANKLGRIDMRTREVSDIAVPWLAGPNAPCTTTDGRVYFSQLAPGAIGEYSPATGTFRRVTVANMPISPFYELNCGPGNTVWLLTVDSVVRIQLG